MLLPSKLSRAAGLLIASACALLLFVVFTREIEPSSWSIIRLKNPWSQTTSTSASKHGGDEGVPLSIATAAATANVPVPSGEGKVTECVFLEYTN
jgi:hypothetical protein